MKAILTASLLIILSAISTALLTHCDGVGSSSDTPRYGGLAR